jgi:hypothetical protein
VAIQRSTPKLGENGHGLPPKITNVQKPEDYDTNFIDDDDENDEDLGAQHSDEEQISKAIGAAAVDDTILEKPKQPSIDKQPSKSKMILKNIHNSPFFVDV